METQTRLMDIIFNEDEISWKNMIYKLVKEEGMDPWDVDIKKLSQRFIDMVRKLKKMDFRISGKVILAAAILLRIKSKRLVGEDFNTLNRLIAMTEDDEDEFYDSLESDFMGGMNEISDEAKDRDDLYKLTPKTPLPRKRKVSVYDLVDALQKALEVKNRRTNRLSAAEETDVKIPEKQRDISEVIQEVYLQIRSYFLEKKYSKVKFSHLIPKEASKFEKVSTFMPLLYLDNQRRIDLFQEKHLDDIEIILNKNNNSIKPITLPD